MATKDFLDVEDLEVHRKLCRLHIEICDLTHGWPQEEKYELGSQARRSWNIAAAQLAEKEVPVSCAEMPVFSSRVSLASYETSQSFFFDQNGRFGGQPLG